MSVTLASDLMGHLGRQLASGRRLLDLVLRQGAAIRRRDVDEVVRAVAEIQAEMSSRSALETERSQLLHRAGAALSVSPAEVTVERLAAVLAPADAQAVVEASAELRGLLAEVAREHGVNRALMRQELTFLDHLTRLVGGEPAGAYERPAGGAPQAPRAAAPSLHVLDARA